MSNNSEEVLIAVLACMALFLLLAGIILLFLFLYRRRRALQQRDLDRLQQQFKEQSLKAQLEIQEQTFQAISREIHDNVGQILSLAKIQANILTETNRMDEGLLQGMKDNIGKAMGDLRDLAGSMSGERIKTQTLYALIFLETERVNRTGILTAFLQVDGIEKEIEPGKKLILFRVLQESIQNCMKHAEATELSIIFHYLEDFLQIQVRDNGKGFHVPAKLQEGRGLGLLNMQTRMRLTGGGCHIESDPGKGVTVHLTIPYA